MILQLVDCLSAKNNQVENFSLVKQYVLCENYSVAATLLQ